MIGSEGPGVAGGDRLSGVSLLGNLLCLAILAFRFCKRLIAGLDRIEYGTEAGGKELGSLAFVAGNAKIGRLGVEKDCHRIHYPFCRVPRITGNPRCRNVDPALLRNPRLTILLAKPAGAGAQLGGKLVELASIQKLVTPYLDLPLGFCLDTCHSYVSGFDLASAAGFQQFMRDAKESLKLQHVPVIHSNDAKAPLGSHLDRHANIGAGYIGLEGFRRLLNHPELCDKAFILETPVNKPGDDKRDVKAMKELVSPKKRLTSKKSSLNGTKSGRKILRST